MRQHPRASASWCHRLEQQERTRLSWRLIEWKVAYYRPDSVHFSRRADFEVSDEDYDAAEVRYLSLCRKLGLTNTLVHKGWPGFEDMYEPRGNYPDGTPMGPMMEVDEDRPSVQLVMAKLSSPKTLKRKPRKTKDTNARTTSEVVGDSLAGRSTANQ
jgi:hypothetical protein